MSVEKYSRQTYIDGDYWSAVLHGYNILQPKYDGIWCACELAPLNDELISCQYYSRNNQLKYAKTIQNISGLRETITLIGEFMYGSERAQTEQLKEKLFVFDVWEHRHLPYNKRYSLARNLLTFLNEPSFCLVPTLPITEQETAWKTYIVDQNFEGLVYRQANASYNEPLIRQKQTFTVDVTVTGFVEGEGRLAGSLGAICAVLSLDNTAGEEVTFTVGGGFSDEERHEIWQNQNSYLGATCEVTGSGQFKSGLLRHPRFVRWHKEK